MDNIFKAWISYIWHIDALKPLKIFYFNHYISFHLNLIRCRRTNSCLFFHTIETKSLASIVVALYLPSGICHSLPGFALPANKQRRSKLAGYLLVGAKKLHGAVFHVSPEGVKHMDMLNNSFAQQYQYLLASCE